MNASMMRFFSLCLAMSLLACANAQPAASERHPLAGKAIDVNPLPAEGRVDLPRFPSISPDGSTLCFSWRGDLWRVPATGGLATRLTAHPMEDDISRWSPDGQSIAFNSDRSGYRNVYRMTSRGAAVQPVTKEDRSMFLSGWIDGETIAMSSFLEADIYKQPRPYRVASKGGEITRLHDAFGRSPAVSPNGRYVAFVRGRASWSKPFLANSDNRDIWIYDRRDESFRQLTKNPANDGMPIWLDNEHLVYLSARPPQRVNVYRLNISTGESHAVALTRFESDDVQWFDVSCQKNAMVLHVWDRLYTLDLSDDEAEVQPVDILVPADTADQTIVKSLQKQANDAVLSPDGKVMAVSIHGELFVRTVGSKNPPQRITRHAALDHELTWSPDGQILYFTSDRDGTQSIYKAQVTLSRKDIKDDNNDEPAEKDINIEKDIELSSDEEESQPGTESDQSGDESESDDEGEDEKEKSQQDNPWVDALRFEIDPVVQTAQHDSDASLSPDGRLLSFRRGNGSLVILDLATGQESVFLSQWDRGMHWAWSSDSRYLAVSYEDQDHNADIWVGPVDGSISPVNVTKHPAMDVLPSFSHDNKILSFVSSREDGQYDVYAVYLDRSLETLSPQELEEYYEAAAKRAKQLKPLRPETADASAENVAADGEEASNDGAAAEPEEVELDLSDAYLRLRRLTETPESEWDVHMLPGGNRIVFTRGGDAYAIGWDGRDEKRIATSFDPTHLSLNGAKVVGLRNRAAAIVSASGGDIEEVAFTGTIRVNRRSLQKQRFIEASRALTMAFYDGTFKGINWQAVTEKYASLAERTWTASEFDDVANRYLGLLTASHMGIRSPKPTAENSQANGRLGASYRRVDEGYEVVGIEPNTPAAEGSMRLMVGDIVTAIDFEPFAESDTVASRLVGRVGRETAITVLRGVEGDEEKRERHLLLTPISYRAYDDVRYNNWRLSNVEKVSELSGGRIGYIHIESMNASSLAEYERDLYAACEGKDALIIDVRDNGGGWTTDRLLASIMTERHAYTVPRGADPTRTNSYPIGRLFIQRYNLPMNALCNEHSFSNAEIFSHAFKTLDRGTLIGNTTAGGVISTGGTRLLDGTTIRLPFRGWFLPNGTDMENNGAVPDILIPQLPQHEVEGRDAQLEAAVNDLLKRLES